MGFKVVLTADRAVMTDYSGAGLFGFGLCLPYRLVPKIVEYRLLAPPVKCSREGRALYAPYSLAKVEASLLASGFSREDVVITHPERVEKVVGSSTRIVGISVLDPMGKAPVSYTLASIFGGGSPCTKMEFLNLMWRVRRLKSRFNFKVVVGGPGTWQLHGLEEKLGIDVLFEGEAEISFPKLVKSLIIGEDVKGVLTGEPPKPDEIPAICTPSRWGAVQVTRGCPRRCHFCSPTAWNFRSMPMDLIMKEVQVNVAAGAQNIDLAAEDVLLYGAKGIQVNEEVVIKLFKEISQRARSITFNHVAFSTALSAKNLLGAITELSGHGKDNPLLPQIGLESGSPRIIEKYMSGKPRPWKPKEWPSVVLESLAAMNDNYWYPCCTLIVGFPDETEDDLVKTIELVDQIKSMNAKAWLFPLFMVPMGGSLLSKERFYDLARLPQAGWDLLSTCWSYSLKFTREVASVLLSGVKSRYLRMLAMGLTDLAISSIGSVFDKLRRDPYATLQRLAEYNLRAKFLHYIPRMLSAVVFKG